MRTPQRYDQGGRRGAVRRGHTPPGPAGTAPPTSGAGPSPVYRDAGAGAGAWPAGRVVNVPRPWVRPRSLVA